MLLNCFFYNKILNYLHILHYRRINLQIGVHISDVGFYIENGTVLDEKASKKATTIYLVNETYHMLPLELCLECSLLPG